MPSLISSSDADPLELASPRSTISSPSPLILTPPALQMRRQKAVYFNNGGRGEGRKSNENGVSGEGIEQKPIDKIMALIENIPPSEESSGMFQKITRNNKIKQVFEQIRQLVAESENDSTDQSLKKAKPNYPGNLDILSVISASENGDSQEDRNIF